MNLPKPTLLLFAFPGLATLASAQVTFSIDYHGPTKSAFDSCAGSLISEGAIMTPATGSTGFGPLATPCIVIDAGATGLGLAFFGSCAGLPPGLPCRVEVDALSYGLDERLGNTSASAGDYLFSTDEFALGGVPPFVFPDLTSEAPFGDSATDVWSNAAPLPPGPLAPFASPVGNTGMIDGDGLLSGSPAVYPGTGLIEPTFPGPPPNTGDNMDAMDFDPSGSITGFPAGGVYFSLDGTAFDPLSAVFNTGAAIGHGFSPGDVIWSAAPGGPPVVYAPDFLLGLGLTGFEDDLDALALWENGVPGYQPSSVPYDWMAAGGPDMLLFSVRRGSAVIGLPDSIFGLPISEGDILTVPLPTGSGGVSPFPGIFCAAENIGLSTLRVAGGNPDDLNALDTFGFAFTDCNGNGVDDALDIISGTSTDVNFNGVPDDCELISSTSCFCPNIFAPCGNPDPTAGCENSTGSGALLTASGTGSVFLDNLILSASGMPSTVPAIFFGGTFPVGPLPFGDGLRCAGGNIVRFTTPAFTSATGDLTGGPGLAAAGGVVPFETWIFQCWYRDPTGPCGSGFNTTNAVTVSFTP